MTSAFEQDVDEATTLLCRTTSIKGRCKVEKKRTTKSSRCKEKMAATVVISLEMLQSNCSIPTHKNIHTGGGGDFNTAKAT